MILVLKHLVLMSFALLLVPLAGWAFAQMAARRRRILRPGLSWALGALRLAVALIVPALAQGLYAVLDDLWPFGARYFALGITGVVYGVLFGNAEDFPRLPSAIWGLVGGIATAWLYVELPPSGEGRAFCVAIFAVLPLLAYRPFSAAVRNRLTTSGLIMPSRRLLR